MAVIRLVLVWQWIAAKSNAVLVLINDAKNPGDILGRASNRLVKLVRLGRHP
jgi:hypothetical protein